MNESTEQVMRGWRPCQPSPGLRKRIFASDPAPVEFARAPLDFAGLMRWLVPALGCCVVIIGIALDPMRPMTGDDMLSRRALDQFP